jgi:2-haloacid dehalogenase
MTLHLRGIEACVFDAYGTLFDVNSAVRNAEDVIDDRCRPLAELWRSKQLQYTWLRALAGHHADFWQVTGDALDFAMSTMQLKDAALREGLMDSYLTLSAFPEVADTLKRLNAAGMKTAILSNGTPTMLAKAASNAGIDRLLDAVFSVEEIKVYKPHPSVYQLACDRLGLPPERICFLSSNGWDAYSAKAFGYHVLWCNRTRQPPERIPETPDAEIASLAELPGIVLQVTS